MSVVHSASLIGVQAYGSAQAARPAARDRAPADRFQVEDVVDTSDKRAEAAKRAQAQAKDAEAAKRDQSDRAPQSSDNAGVGHREAPGVGREGRRPPGSLVNLIA